MRKRKKKPVKLPAYCQHKHSGQAVVYLDGQQVYLGKYGSDASWSRYHRVLAEWQAHGRVLAAPQEEVTVNEVLLAYLRHAWSIRHLSLADPFSDVRPEGRP